MIYALNENIKKLRISSGLNQVELAKRLGVTKQCVSNWENGNVLPSIEMLVSIANAFKVTTDYLLGCCSNITVDVSGLTEEQTGHIILLIKDLESLNKKTEI